MTQTKLSLPFFGGDPSGGKLFKTVQPLSCKTFKDFFETQLWVPITLNLSRDEYESTSEAGRKKAKMVPYFTPCTFKEKDDKGRFPKNNANAKVIRLVCIDIDPEKDKETKEEISFPAAPLFQDPAIFWQALDGLNFAVYTTLNHTPEAPRLRVLVEADGFDPSLYAEAVNHIGASLGLPFINSESKVISQAMFRPTVFNDETGVEYHPVIAHNTKGRALSQDDFSGAEPLPGQTKTQKTGEGILDGLEFLQPTVEGITLEDAKEALNAISPNCEMFDWIRCAMALKHQFPDNEEAFEVFNEWSAPGNTYEGEEKTRYRWDHVKANTTSRLPTTIKTLFKLAKDSGWSNPDMEQRHFQELAEWIAARGTLGELVDDGMKRIVATPNLTFIYEEALVRKIQQRAKKKFGFDTTPAKMLAKLKSLKSEVREKQRKQDETEKGTPVWARGLIYISRAEVFYRFGTGEAVSRSSFDSAFGKHLLPTDKELEERGETSRQAKATPVLRPQDHVLNELDIPRAYDLGYFPAHPDDHITKKGGVRFVNTYRRTFAKPDPDKAERHGKIIQDHIGNLIEEKEHQIRLLDFIAFMVQNPGHKVRWAYLIQSAQGNGKGLIAKALRGVFGHGNIKTVDPDAIFSSFNDWAMGSQITILNEIRVTGHSRHDVMNKLKEPIADDHVSINQKFADNREVDNVTNYLMFTNHRDALALEERERRYFVVFSPLQTERDIDRLHESGKLKPLQDLVDANQFGGLRSFFEQWDISPDFCPNSPPPKTKYFREMTKLTKGEVDAAVDDLIKEGGNPWIAEDLLSASSLLTAVNAELPRATSGKVVNSCLAARGFKYVGRMTVKGERHQVWIEQDSIFEGLDLVEILEARINKNQTDIL